MRGGTRCAATSPSRRAMRTRPLRRRMDRAGDEGRPVSAPERRHALPVWIGLSVSGGAFFAGRSRPPRRVDGVQRAQHRRRYEKKSRTARRAIPQRDAARYPTLAVVPALERGEYAQDHVRVIVLTSPTTRVYHVRRGSVHRRLQVLRAADRCPGVRPPVQRHHRPERVR